MLNDGQLAPACGTGEVTTTPTAAWGPAVPPGRRTQFRSSCPGTRPACREAPSSPLPPWPEHYAADEAQDQQRRHSGSAACPAMGQKNTSETELTAEVIPA